MKQVNSVADKIYTLNELEKEVNRWRLKGQSIAMTNGVFDLLHEGHISSLQQAAEQADMLIVAVNADDSVRRLKGNDRPVQSEKTRSLLLASLVYIDGVILFNSDTPLELISTILPDVLVKGGDYTIDEIAGAKEVLEAGGQVILANMVDGVSTTRQIQLLQNKF